MIDKTAPAQRFGDGGCVFPEPMETPWLKGHLTVRDYFAAYALQGMLAAHMHSEAVTVAMNDHGMSADEANRFACGTIADCALELADALLAARTEPPK